jgi:hypothetical protein
MILACGRVGIVNCVNSNSNDGGGDDGGGKQQW